MAKPAVVHLVYGKQMIRYLNGSRKLGITFGKVRDTLPRAYNLYTDATWATEEDRLSFGGWVIHRYGGAIAWSAQRQKSIALSSMEAEIMAASDGAREVMWMELLVTDLAERVDGIEPYIPTLYCDNQGAVDLLLDTKFHQKAKHIEVRYFFLRKELIQRNPLVIQHIPGVDQPADMLTKQLGTVEFRRHMGTLGEYSCTVRSVWKHSI